MNFSLITEYPLWFVVFCIGLAAAYTYILYRKDKRFQEVSKTFVWLMSGFRFVVVLFLSFLLLSPLVKSFSHTLEKPIILIAQDNSQSIKLGTQEAANQLATYQSKLTNLITELSQKYDVKTYSFGDSVKKNIDYSFKDKQTNFSDLLKYLQNNYYNRNVGALVVASDGIYNQGNNPVYALNEINYPIYTVGLGDTTVHKDIIISQIKQNKVAYVGNKFPLQIYIDIKELNGVQTELKVTEKETVLFTKPIKAIGNSYSEIVNIEIEAKEKGIHRYHIELKPDNQEISAKNNVRDVIVEVIENKQRILMLANSPHPDMGAIKSVLEMNQNYDVESYNIADFTKSIATYNLVILHQIPSVNNTAPNLFSGIAKNNVPVLFILGTQISLQSFNNLNLGFSIERGTNFEETLPETSESFSLFELGTEIKKFSTTAPALFVPFGEYKTLPALRVLFYQKNKNVVTSKPLIAFNIESGGSFGKYAIVAGEGLWRWRIDDYHLHDNHNIFNDLISKMVQLLISKEKKERFNIITKKIVNETDPILFDAEVYNESFELVNNEDVTIEITDQQNKKFNYQFNKTGKSYFLNAGLFPVGDYTYKAKTRLDGKDLEKISKFTVIPVNIEEQNTIADHHLLYQLSQKTNGTFFNSDKIDDLKKAIESNKNIVPVSFPEKNLQDFINFKWLFFLLLALLSAEWFLRKFLGGY